MKGGIRYALLLGSIVAGCAPPSTPVYVDLETVLRLDTAPKPKGVPIPEPPAALPPVSVVQPGRKAVSLRDPSRSSEREVRQAIEERQRRDYLRLVERLKEFYAADALRFEQEQMRTQSVEELEAYEKVNARIREIFERYGRERAPLVADLTLLVGFPDPNPQGVTPRVPLGNVDRQRLEKAQRLREQIQALEAEFDQQTAAIVSELEAQVGQKLSELRERIRQYRVENDRRAEIEAAQQVQQSVRALGLRLTEPVRLTLPAIPDRVTTQRGAPAPQPAPKVTSQGILATPEDRRLLATRQLEIWAAQRRYAIAKRPSGAKDKTEEFIAWRNNLLSGR